MKQLHRICCATAALILAVSAAGAGCFTGFAATAEDGNLAYGKTAWMSLKTGQTNNVKLTDGVRDTGNVNYTRSNGAEPKKPWFLVDLGEKVKFNELVIQTGSQAVTKQYTVWFTNNEQTPPAFDDKQTQTENGTIKWGANEWTQALDASGNEISGELNMAGGEFTTPMIANVPEEGAQYVLLVLDANRDTRIGEIEVYLVDSLRVTSDLYQIDQEKQEITVSYSHTDIAEIKKHITCETGVYEIYCPDGTTPAGTFEPGCSLKAWNPAAPEKVKTYTLVRGEPSGNTVPIAAAGQGRVDGTQMILSESAVKSAEAFAAAVAPPALGSYTVLRGESAANFPLQSRDVVRVTAEDGKTVADYTIKVNLAWGKTAAASAVYNNNSSYGPDKAVDGDSAASRWATPNGTTEAWLRVDLGVSKVLDQCVIREYGSNPGIRDYTLEYSNDSEVTEETVWTPIPSASGSGIGKEKVLDFEPIKARHVRLSLTNAVSAPTIFEFELYCLTEANGETVFGTPKVQDGKILIPVQEGNPGGTRCQLAAAAYEDNMLTHMSVSQPLNTVLGEQNLSVDIPAGCQSGDTISVFVWDSMDTLVPLTEGKIVLLP